MNKEKINKKIKQHTRRKRIILSILLMGAILFGIGILCGKLYTSVFGYILIIIAIVSTYFFTLDTKLTNEHTTEDFFEILDYLANIKDYNLRGQTYVDGLIMIGNSIDEIVHYKMNYVNNQCLEDCMFYLQGKLHAMKLQKVYNIEYIETLCKELQKQIKNKKFSAKNLDSIKTKEESSKKYVLHKNIMLIICNALLIVIMLFKIVYSVDLQRYNSIESNELLRVIYNSGADILAVAIAVASYIKNKK